MMTHMEFIAVAKPARHCTAHDATFGGACFNCGYDPAKQNDQQQTKEKA